MSFHLNIDISNPFVEDYRNEDYFCKDWKITTHKYVSLQVPKFDKKRIFEMTIWWRGPTMDHKGFLFDFFLFGFGFILDFYDNRHSDSY